LVREIRLSFFALKARAEALHADPAGLTAGHRGVLESLSEGGARTVPALARARPVSRQHIQVLVNRLLELGLVATRQNPASRRSPLIELTPAGRQRFRRMLARERAAFPDNDLPISETRLREAAETLRSLRGVLGEEGEG
jgi:DNA-binding MarR family transcriptional regulator